GELDQRPDALERALRRTEVARPVVQDRDPRCRWCHGPILSSDPCAARSRSGRVRRAHTAAGPPNASMTMQATENGGTEPAAANPPMTIDPRPVPASNQMFHDADAVPRLEQCIRSKEPTRASVWTATNPRLKTTVGMR